ncbi:TetR family transcriptional regulator [Pantoea sp. 1.19]|uniref:TetR family transcriptional regulator n=1 Tax=Pantoea sp. 1.19 TaxID=1925589 RepID=UPI00094892FB|nr:TetR family transcriptional regulator [Pantoea sp. 1.19]
MPDTPKRKNDPEGLKRRILDSALAAFAESGMQGARLEQIAALAATTKRMVVYHFGNKERLYIAVLEDVYQHIRQHEIALNLSALPPIAAMQRLVEASFDYHAAHPDMMRVICSENLLRGRYISQSSHIQGLNRSALDLLASVLARGQQSGDFRHDLATLEVHRLISSLCFHHVSNRYTFNTLFAGDQPDRQLVAQNRQLAVTATLRFVCR